ncbi:MAG: glycosyltransferase family 2 protein [Hyphomonadaceae bacterium]
MGQDVTVLITCHNEGAYVGEAAEAVLAQTAFARIAKIIIVNDGSTDGSHDVLRALAARSDKIELCFQAPARGVSAARNLGLRRITTPWVAFCDGDDYWTADKLETQLSAAATHPDAALIYTNFIQFAGRPEDGAYIKARTLHARGEALLKDYFLFDAPVMPSTVLLRMDAAVAIDFFDERIKLFEDTDFVMRLAGAGFVFAHVTQALLYKRVRAGSLSSRIENWEGAMLQETAASVARHPRLRPLAARRDSYRLAKIAEAHFMAGEDEGGWRALRAAHRRNRINPRVYAYGAIASIPRESRHAAKSAVRGARRALTSRQALALSACIFLASCVPLKFI